MARLSRQYDEYPDCPNCETDVFVEGANSDIEDWQCHFCGAVWSDDDTVSSAQGGDDGD